MFPITTFNFEAQQISVNEDGIANNQVFSPLTFSETELFVTKSSPKNSGGVYYQDGKIINSENSIPESKPVPKDPSVAEFDKVQINEQSVSQVVNPVKKVEEHPKKDGFIPISQEEHNKLLTDEQERERRDFIPQAEIIRNTNLTPPQRDKPARLSVVLPDGSEVPGMYTTSFIIQSAEEGFEARHSVVETFDGQVLENYGRGVLIWQYSGVSLDTAIESRSGTPIQTTNFFDQLRLFLLNSIGIPTYQGQKAAVRLDIGEEMRVGYILAFRYSRNSLSPRLINVAITILIDEYLRWED